MLHDAGKIGTEPHGGLLSIPMATTAQRGYVGRIGGRLLVLFGKCAMPAVAIETVWSILVAFGEQRPVNAPFVLPDLVGMANGAVHGLWRRAAGPHGILRRDPGVTLGATGRAMGRVAQLVAADRKQGAARGSGLLLFMADHAVAITDTFLVEYLTSLVRLMTIDAHGNDFRLLFPQLALDDLLMNLLDQGVTFGTYPDDIVAVNA